MFLFVVRLVALDSQLAAVKLAVTSEMSMAQDVQKHKDDADNSKKGSLYIKKGFTVQQEGLTVQQKGFEFTVRAEHAYDESLAYCTKTLSGHARGR